MRFDENLHSRGVTTGKRILHRDMSVCVLREREREEEEQVEEWTWRRKQKRKRIPFASKLKDNKCRILLLTPNYWSTFSSTYTQVQLQLLDLPFIGLSLAVHEPSCDF